jgi:hypothetical protein
MFQSVYQIIIFLLIANLQQLRTTYKKQTQPLIAKIPDNYSLFKPSSANLPPHHAPSFINSIKKRQLFTQHVPHRKLNQSRIQNCPSLNL